MVQSDMTLPVPKILLLEDSNLDAELIREHLNQLSPPPEIHVVTNRMAFVSALEVADFDLILSDFSLPDFDGMSALELVSQKVPDVPFIFVSGVLGEEAAIESFHRGATDYVLKQRLVRLPAAVDRALAEARQRTEHRRAEHQKEMLVRELSHRVKNTMAVVMSLVQRTARNSSTVQEYSDNLMGRLRAMADAHALLFETNWSEAELREILNRTLAPYAQGRTDRFRIEAGPAVFLDPKAALALSMVFHELTTNAMKYGALAHGNGLIAVSWTRDDLDNVRLEWREVDGPRIIPPEEQGFGTTLIQRSVQYELRGVVTLEYEPNGLICKIAFTPERL